RGPHRYFKCLRLITECVSDHNGFISVVANLLKPRIIERSRIRHLRRINRMVMLAWRRHVHTECRRSNDDEKYCEHGYADAQPNLFQTMNVYAIHSFSNFER